MREYISHYEIEASRLWHEWKNETTHTAKTKKRRLLDDFLLFAKRDGVSIDENVLHRIEYQISSHVEEDDAYGNP